MPPIHFRREQHTTGDDQSWEAHLDNDVFPLKIENISFYLAVQSVG